MPYAMIDTHYYWALFKRIDALFQRGQQKQQKQLRGHMLIGLIKIKTLMSEKY